MDDLLSFLGVIFAAVLTVACAILLISLPWFIWGDTRVGEIKLAAPGVWERNGFQIVGYEGYQLTIFGRPGGCVWYVVKREATSYHGCISRWGDEYHIYDLRALNAIKGG